MAKLVVLKSFMEKWYDNMIEKSTAHKYIRRVPKSTGKGYNYFYPKDFAKPMKALLSFFGMKEESVDNAYKNNNIQAAYGVTKQGFAQHVLEYLTNRKTWNAFFANKNNRDRYKTPEKPVKESETVKVSEKIIEGGRTKEKITVEEKETKEKNFKSTWNRSLMRKIYSMYNSIPEDKAESKPGLESIKVGDSVSYNGQSGKVEKDFENGLVFVKFDNGGMGRFFVKDLQKLNPTSEEVTETATENAETQDVNGTNEAVQEEVKDTSALSEAMMGNQNAKKDFLEEKAEIAEKAAQYELDKAEFKGLVDRLNELNKEFSSNGGYSNRRTTREEDEKRKAAQKEIRVVEEKLKDFRNRIKEENKGSFQIPAVYHDAMNEWIKRKMKGQTISDDWLRKKFGGYYSDALSFGDGYSFSLGDTDDINNPTVRINYVDSFNRPEYAAVNIAEMEKENYRPRYMPNDEKAFTEVWDKIRSLKEQLDNASGSTMTEKFFNTVMGISNAYNENSDTSNIPRYRFTKDGIKDKSGNLEKINATIREDENGDEYIQLYADDYGASIPSIFYPVNNTDTMTDYFEKDRSVVRPDHPYYNHLKLMALKRELYRGRATKWASLSKEQQDEISEKIKGLEKQLVEPTEEDLKKYREKRDVQEEQREILNEAGKKIRKEMREKAQIESFYNLLSDALKQSAKPDIRVVGGEEQETRGGRIIDSKEERADIYDAAYKANIEKYKGMSKEELERKNQELKAQFESLPKNSEEAVKIDGERYAIMSEYNKPAEEPRDELVTPVPQIDKKTAERINDISMLGTAGNVYQHDVNIEMQGFKDRFDYDKMNQQQKEYFQERINDYAGLVGDSYNEMASKRLAAGPSWAVAGPAKYNTKRFNQKMEAERRAYETFEEKKEKFIKNTEKRLKELKYTGGAEDESEVKKRVFDDYSRGKWGYGDKVDNTDPYAIEKISGKIKFMEDAHDVTLLYNKNCKKNGITTMSWADRTDEDKAKRKEVLAQTAKEAKEKGYSAEVIKQGVEHPFTSNQTADIRRNKQRLEELQKRQTVIEERKNTNDSGAGASSERVYFDGGYIYENPELDRIQIIYDGKPDREVIDKLKHNGFRWSPSQKAWQRQLNRNGRYAVNQIMSETGKDVKIDIDGAGEVTKSLPAFIIKGGRFLIRK